jgi:DNA-binding GntR family transcriptional regulator
MATAPTVGTSAERVYAELRSAILRGEYAPGERLRTAAIAERLGTSRTPVREALVLLEGDGLVELEPRRGALVRTFDPEDLIDLYEVRALLEARAAQRAATRITPQQVGDLEDVCRRAERAGTDDLDTLLALNEEFHRIVIAAAGSPRLSAALRTVAGIPGPFKVAFWGVDEQRERSLADHREIASTLRAGSAERAETAMRLHILNARDYLNEVMRERV